MALMTFFATVALIIPVFFLAIVVDLQRSAKKARRRTGLRGSALRMAIAGSAVCLYILSMFAELAAVYMLVALEAPEGSGSRPADWQISNAAIICFLAVMALTLTVGLKATSGVYRSITKPVNAIAPAPADLPVEMSAERAARGSCPGMVFSAAVAGALLTHVIFHHRLPRRRSGIAH